MTQLLMNTKDALISKINNTKDALISLTKNNEELFTWFANNKMKANHENCYLLLSRHEETNIQLKFILLKIVSNYLQNTFGRLLFDLTFWN